MKPPPATGLVTGTIVLTLDGALPVEYLLPGDRIITRDAGMARLDRIRHCHETARAIRFAAGSMGPARPERDLVLPAAQTVLLRGGRTRTMFGSGQTLVPAAALVDGEFIHDLGQQDMLLHQLCFTHPHVIYAGGLELTGPGLAGPALHHAA